MKYISDIDFSKLTDEYQNNEHFPHIVIDNFFKEEELQNILDNVTILDVNDSTDKFTNKKFEYNKFGFCYNELNDKCKDILRELSSPEFMKKMEVLTGIDNLVYNEQLRGAGVHKISKDGLLATHTDFNMYTDKNFGLIDRRINILIYLNKDWKEEYGGHLELFDQNLKPFKKILPILNRCVIFSTTNKSLHGHPYPLKCPENIVRQSIANYYYTQNTSSDKITKAKDFEGDTVHGTLFFDVINNDKTPYEWNGTQFVHNLKYTIKN